MATAYREHYTVEDYRLWEGDWELIEGMPYAMTPSPSVTHQTVALINPAPFYAILRRLDASQAATRCAGKGQAPGKRRNKGLTRVRPPEPIEK